LTGRLEDQEAVLSRLEITRETMTEILSGDGSVQEPELQVRPHTPRRRAATAAKGGERPAVPEGPLGVRLVPQWTPDLTVGVLPRVYQDIVEVLSGAVHPMRAHHLSAALGLSTDKSKVEGFRPKLKRLVERGWLTEDAPGLFAARDAAAARAPERVAPVWGRALVFSVDGANQIHASKARAR
jgi:hypothetical protein